LPFNAAYAASKYSMRVFTDVLRRELRPWGIYVGIIEPSYVKTAIGQRSVESTKGVIEKLPKEAMEYYGEEFKEEVLIARQKQNEKKIPIGLVQKLDN